MLLKDLDFIFICLNHFSHAGSDQLSKGWSVSFIWKHKQPIFLSQHKMTGNVSFCATCIILQKGGQEEMWAPPIVVNRNILAAFDSRQSFKNLLNDHLIKGLQHRRPWPAEGKWFK